MLTLGTQHYDADPVVMIQLLEDQTQLVALRYLDDVQGLAVEDKIGPLPVRADLHPESIKILQQPGPLTFKGRGHSLLTPKLRFNSVFAVHQHAAQNLAHR